MPQNLVMTFSDRAQAQAAYEKLKSSDLALGQIDLLGTGYRTLQETNLYDPNQVAWQQATRMLYWVVPFGFVAGFSFNEITHLAILERGSALANHIIGGFFGAIASAMGGFTFGGGGQFLIDREKMPFHKRLKAGKYLLVAQGTELLIRQASRMLQGFPADSLQFYEDVDR
ncbi:hypothetical protein [Altericista sp. CCNU0014]|uniref:hypothetical protein n=1 Tax=Altericista sp. CCNU0014 TaxID=3082949 RepID=UPI003850401D